MHVPTPPRWGKRCLSWNKYFGLESQTPVFGETSAKRNHHIQPFDASKDYFTQRFCDPFVIVS